MDNYAPVLITTLNRTTHLKKCIESLQKNPVSVYTDLYIYLDYPLKEEHYEGYFKTLSYLNKGIDGFHSVNITKRGHNYGFLRNQRCAMEDIFLKYDCVIRTNDDAEFSPNFLEWINKGLKKYKEDESVLAILGYSYPIEWNVSKDATAIKQSFVCSEWGIGYWKEKYLSIEKILKNKYFIKSFVNNQKKRKYRQLIDARYIDYLIASSSCDKDSLYRKVTDISLGTYIGLEHKYAIMPVLSKVRDNGFDGTGVYCGKVTMDTDKEIDAHNYDYSRQPIDHNEHIEIIENHLNNEFVNRNLLNAFDNRSRKNIWEARIRCFVFHFVGERNFDRLKRLIHKKH